MDRSRKRKRCGLGGFRQRQDQEGEDGNEQFHGKASTGRCTPGPYHHNDGSAVAGTMGAA